MKIITQAKYVTILSHFCADEQERPYLSGVFFEKHKKKGIIMTATNGHILGTIYDENGILEGVPAKDDGVIIPISKGLNKCINATKFEKLFSYVDGLASVVNADMKRASLCDKPSENHLHTEYTKPIDGTFPDWRRVLPKGEFKPVDRFSFNPKYLGMFKFKDHTGTSIFCMDERSPALVKIPSFPEFIGVVMPMHVGADSKYPEWIER